MLIDLFINAGWHTVPLRGKLERLANGDKTVPGFDKDWREKFSTNFNTERTKLAGAITGARSGIVAIDCDNDVTYDMFKALDPDYAFHFVSKGKPSGGGTIIYKYIEGLGSFKLADDFIALDFYSDEGFIYLPTEHNYTKESWEGVAELPPLREAPDTVITLLKALKLKVLPEGVTKNKEVRHTISNRLAPLLENFVKNKKYDPVLFKVITPRSFRDLPTYVKKGHLHPNDVPEGRGSEYLSKISAILGADISVNIELYTNVMSLINGMWDRPMDKKRLMTTIIEPMIEEKVTIDGNVVWDYDPHWEKMGFIATSLNGDYIESFYDDIKGVYYLINYTVPYVRSFSDKRPLITTLRTLLGRSLTETQYDSTKQIIRTTLNPSLEFGHVSGTDQYNLFRQTEELAVLNNPGPYKDQYKRPTTILRYLESLIPDDFMRQYVVRFLRTKFTSFKYSPIVLYFIGVPGSGKDTFVSLCGYIIGKDYIAKPDTKVFLEQYNGWMIDKYFVHLDEYGNKLTRSSDKQEALGKLKAYTGSPEMQLRAMRSDGCNYTHSATFISSANSNPMPIETDDRRVAYIKTPNVLPKEEWVIEAGGISAVQAKIRAEVMDFCYYLATEVEPLTADEYVIAPETADKEKLILEGLPAVEQIVYYMQHGRYDELVYLATEYGIDNFTMNWEKGRLEDEKLAELYDAMTEGHGVHRTLVMKLKDINIRRSHTTKNKQNSFYYYINGLHKFKDAGGEESEEVTFENSGVKGL